MAGNFDFLLTNEYYDDFATACVEAERSMLISSASAVAASRRAMELIIKWIYRVDKSIRLPLYGDSLIEMMNNPDFIDNIDDPKLMDMLHFIRKLGNKAIHGASKIKKTSAITALRGLFDFVDFIESVYGMTGYTKRSFDESKVPTSDDFKEFIGFKEAEALKDKFGEDDDKSLEDARDETAENIQDDIENAKQRSKDDPERIYRVDPYTEAETRKEFINLDLDLAGWKLDSNYREEVRLKGMPNSKNEGYADYVLYGKDGLPLAVVEAKKTSRDPRVGSHQASLYADCLKEEYGRRPFYFFTNGFRTYFVDDEGQRLVSGFYSPEDLQRLMDRRKIGKSLDVFKIDDNITNRSYQKQAILASIEAFNKKKRAALLVMATGTGKTRTAISIVDIMTKASQATNILFLADRTALVNQAMRNFSKLLPNLSLTNLTEAKRDKPETIKASRMIFSTYQTMINSIDNALDERGERIFTVGHFDLIVIDEAHRSIYQKYKSIFDYFDAKILGLTATPRDDIDKNTYEIFNLEDKVPTFAYSLEEAIRSGHLVDFYTIEARLKLPHEGIDYYKLDDEEKKEFEDTFWEDDKYIRYIEGSAINNWVFNKKTVDKVITHFMQEGIKTGSGDDIGKTIVFARNQAHADLIKERFDILYPQKGPDYAKVISYNVNYAQDLIDKFSIKDGLPQIAISVNMLDTGIDVPEIVNLVFFKPVYSKIMFWQMIGRGTRLCPDLFGEGIDKTYFLIFDYGDNFERFKVEPPKDIPQIIPSLTANIFNTRAHIAYYLQESKYKDENYQAYRQEIVENLVGKVARLNQNAYDVIQNREYYIRYRDLKSWGNLETGDLADIKGHIAELIEKDTSHELSQRFDLNMLKIQQDLLEGTRSNTRINILIETAGNLSKKDSLSRVKEKIDTINKVLEPGFFDNIDILDLEKIRKDLRDLIPLLDKPIRKTYSSNFKDDMTIKDPTEGLPPSVDLRPYDQRVKDYIRQKAGDSKVLNKIYNNEELTKEDFYKLEEILWNDLGSKEEYQKAFGDKSIFEIMRKLVGLNKEKIQANFSEMFEKYDLNADQARFINTIIEYFEKNGYLSLEEIQKDPFKSIGYVGKIFANDKSALDLLIGKINYLNGFKA